MPIEIRELVIKAEVDSGARQQSVAEAGGGALSEDAIQGIVDKVVDIINSKKER